jgi:hypothetical protein
VAAGLNVVPGHADTPGADVASRVLSARAAIGANQRTDPVRAALLSIMLAATLATPLVAGAEPMHGRPAIALRIPILPLAWIAAHVRGLFGHAAEIENGSALSREQGWTVLDLPVNEPATALYVEVAGRVQFDSAEIVFRDGAPRPLDLRGVVRGRGFFELHTCAGPRAVTAVRLNVRATTARAQVGIRIARG